jgi:spore maturation protein CgeB
LVIILKGLHIQPNTIKIIKKKVNYVVNWNTDDFFNKKNNSKYLLKSFSHYDCIFTARSHLITSYLDKGAKRVEILDWYYNPKYQYKITMTENDIKQYGSDIVFVGNWSRRREMYLQHLAGLNLKVWGSGWQKADKKFKDSIECRNPIFELEMSKVFCSSKIVINLLTIENKDTTNFRNFEVPACGAFQLCEYSDRISKLFENNKEIVFFKTPSQLRDSCIFYLENNQKRELISYSGYLKVINGENTITDRANNLLQFL